MRVYNYETNNNIVYLDYSTSSSETGSIENSSKPDSLSNIMKNNILIMDDNVFYLTIEK